ncbi:MAG: protein-disulfide reductase DsbD [Pseudomonadota bacterium]
MKRLILLLSILLAPLTGMTAEVGEELLEPEKAFQLKAWVKDSDTLITRWKIADGYFMYRSKFTFNTDTDGVVLGEPNFPAGKIKHDEFFGEVEIYRKEISIELPWSRSKAGIDRLELKTISQGCADIGVCYPPLTQTAALTLPTGGGATPSSTGADPLAALKGLSSGLGGSSNEFLEPDQAFQLSVDVRDANTLIVQWKVAEGYYLYRDKIGFELKDTDAVDLGSYSLPQGKIKNDEFFGRIEVYEHDLQVDLPLKRTAQTEIPLTLISRYQGCATAGICYPPISKSTKITLPPRALTVAANTSAPSTPSTTPTASNADSDGQGFQSEQDRIAQTLASGAGWVTILAFFGFGLLLAFTPCVFPMIPILSGIIIGQGKSITTNKAFTLSLVYVLAMAATYTIAGVLVGLSGENIQVWFQNPWVLSIFAGIFALLALSMFGFYELQMPGSIQSRLTQISNHQQGGTLAGAAIMGFLSALIVGPCVTAPLIGALIYIANTGDALMGGVALFSLSMGMGAPLLVIGTSAGKLLPKVGPWMEATKAVFGVLLLGVGIWLLERILPIETIMVLTGVLLIVSAIYMGAIDTIKQGVSGWFRLWKGIGLVMLIYGALLLIGAAAGSKSILQPLKGVAMAGNATSPSQHGLNFERIKGMPGLQSALERASQVHRPLMLDLYADWCISCKEMEAYTFTDAKVQAALNNVILVQADVTRNDEADQRLLKELGLFGPPAILFYPESGQEQRPYRVVGFMPAEQFSQHVIKALGMAQ